MRVQSTGFYKPSVYSYAINPSFKLRETEYDSLEINKKEMFDNIKTFMDKNNLRFDTKIRIKDGEPVLNVRLREKKSNYISYTHRDIFVTTDPNGDMDTVLREKGKQGLSIVDYKEGKTPEEVIMKIVEECKDREMIIPDDNNYRFTFPDFTKPKS